MEKRNWIFIVKIIALLNLAIIISPVVWQAVESPYDLSHPLFLFFMLIWLILSIPSLISAIGLWKLKNWARILQIVIAILSLSIVINPVSILVTSLTVNAKTIIHIAIVALEIYFLGINKGVKSLFTRKKSVR